MLKAVTSSGGGGGSPSFSNITSGTNTTAAMVIGSGASFTNNGPALAQKPVVANSSTAYTIDPANGAQFDVTLTANTTLTLQVVTSGEFQVIKVRLIQDGTGGRIVTWANITWESGVAPTVATAIGSSTYLEIYSNGTTWYGDVVPQGTGTGAVVQAVAPTITTTNLAGTTTIGAGQIIGTRVVIAAGVVTVTAADYMVIVNKTSGAATTLNLPAGVLNTVFIIKDGKGDAGANNITVTPAAGNIDGASTYVMNTNYAAIGLVYNGTQWNIF